jgi:hypothetical protein
MRWPITDIIGVESAYDVKQTAWRYDGGYRVNTGSGVVGRYSIRRCDSSFPKGPLTYQLKHPRKAMERPRTQALPDPNLPQRLAPAPSGGERSPVLSVPVHRASCATAPAASCFACQT